MECNLCHKTFTTKQSLNYHLLHQVCSKKKCKRCGAVFSSRSAFHYHNNNNVCGQPKMKIVIKKNSSTTEELLTKIAILEAENKLLVEKPRTVTVNNNNNINFIFPKAFGTEQLTHILSKLPNLLRDALTLHPGRSVEFLTEQIHCNKEIFPEYTNVYIRGYKSPYALVSNGHMFQNKPQKRIIEQIIEDSISMLQTHIDNNGENYGQRIIDKYEKYRDLVEGEGELHKNLEIEIAGMLLDMRPIIESTPNIKKMLNQLEQGIYE